MADAIQSYYERAMIFAFRHWKKSMLALGLCAAGSVLALVVLEKTTFPAMDSLVSTVEVVLPENATLERTKEAALAFTARINQIDSLAQTVALGGFTDQTRPDQMAKEKLNRFTLRISNSSMERKRAVLQEIARLRRSNPDWNVVKEEHQLFGDMGVAGGEGYVDVQLTGQDRKALTGYSDALRPILQTMFSDSIQTVFPETIAILELKPKQALWVQYGFSAGEITMQLEAHGLGRLATRWNRQEQSEDIRLFMANTGETSIGDRKIRLASANWAIKDLFDIRTIQQPEVLTRQHQGKMITLRIFTGYASFVSVQKALREALRTFIENRNVDVRLAGPVIETDRLVRRISTLLTFSVVLIFLILAMQYESIGYPFLILFSIPFSWMGAVGLVWAMDLSLNVFSMLGILILTGIAVNDAILKIDFMKRYYEDHGNAKDAAFLAGKNRFRPVVMTTLTTILGLVPMLFPFGSAPEITQSLGAALVGGMVSSTVLTLFMMPQFFVGYHRVGDYLKTGFLKKGKVA